MVLLIDNYDSFTFNIVDYFYRCGVECTVKKNDELNISDIIKLNPKAIILSPGPNTPNEAGILIELVSYFYNKLPILGICLGHQAIGMHFGYKLIKAKVPMHGKTSIILHNKKGIFASIDQEMEVMRYHSLILKDDIINDIEVIARTKENEIMAIAHKEFPLIGLQFHPESILTKEGLKLLENWVAIYLKNEFISV